MTTQPRLLVVSNRLPVSIERAEDGFAYQPAVGGLATSLEAVRQEREMLWLGWPGIHVTDPDEQKEIQARLLEEFGSVPLFLPEDTFDAFYSGFSNGTLWPLFHYFPQYAHYDSAEWEAYQAVNRLFRDRIIEIAQPNDRLWIHDYHLMTLPALVRKALPRVRIGFFLHIPFPTSELFRMLPWREEILEGVLGADLVGFHTHGYGRHFQSSVLRLLGLEQEFGRVTSNEHTTKIDTFPLGVPMDRFKLAVEDEAVQAELKRLKDEAGDRRLIVMVDRLDFSKGIPERLRTFELFLERNPEWLERVTMISLAVPSRTDVPEYQALKREVDELVGKINGRFGTPGWVPIWYLYRFMPFDHLVALYRAGDVALVTPLRDGMNLVAKEYLAARPEGDGVLILSETAGAAEELGEALIVNPHDFEQNVHAIERALTMTEAEQHLRNRPMLARLRRYDLARWAEDFLNELEPEQEPAAVQVELRGQAYDNLLDAYRSGERRLIFLDYDGTMVHFAPRPEDAAPDEDLLKLLRALTADPKNTVVIISGRDKDTLHDWLGDVGADLVAEHGAQVRGRGEPGWRAQGTRTRDGWRQELRPVLELYVDRTPGAIMEEKSASLAWHYRRAEPELGDLRAKQLMETLEAAVANTPLVVMQGNKVVEIKESEISKGRAAQRWLDRDPGFDFILATGDDVTDEEMFEAMPDEAWTVRVGEDPHSAARYLLHGPDAVRELLRELA